jgi:hypothetical protein
LRYRPRVPAGRVLSAAAIGHRSSAGLDSDHGRAVGIVLFVTVLLDLRKGPSRDWLHWVGVAMIFTNVLLSTAWFVWTILANYVIP